MTDIEIEGDRCILEVTVIHSLQNFKTTAEKFKNVATISQYFQRIDKSAIDPNNPDLVIQLQFTNRQLDCELKIIDSMEDSSDKFTFVIWNVPDGTIMVEGDYLLFKFYWNSDPTTYTTYHGIINTIKSKRTVANLQTTVKGNIVNQDILYNWSIYDKYPKLTYYKDVEDFIENELHYNFTPLVPGFIDKIQLTKPILTYNKSVGDILEEVCKQASKSTGEKCSWKFINNNTILLYKASDLGTQYLNNRYNMRVPSVTYNSLFNYAEKTDGITIELTGIPTVVAGIVLYIDTTGIPSYITTKSAYYVINEVEHNIKLDSGYMMKLYCDLANPESGTNG